MGRGWGGRERERERERIEVHSVLVGNGQLVIIVTKTKWVLFLLLFFLPINEVFPSAVYCNFYFALIIPHPITLTLKRHLRKTDKHTAGRQTNQQKPGRQKVKHSERKQIWNGADVKENEIQRSWRYGFSTLFLTNGVQIIISLRGRRDFV